MSKESKVSNFPANLATKAEAGLMLGNVMRLSRTTSPEIRSVRFFGSDPREGGISAAILLDNNDGSVLTQVYDAVDPRRSDVELRLGEESYFVAVTGLVGDADLESDESQFLGGRVLGVWKPKK